MLKKVISGVLMLAIMATSVFYAFAQDVSSLESRQAELEAQNKEYEKILAQKKNEVAKQQEYVDAIVGKVTNVNEEITLSREKISALDDSIKEKSEAIDKANKDLENQMDTLRGRIRAIYMAGDVSSLEVILGAKNFTDFIDKVQLVKSVSDFDKKLMDDIQGQLDAVSEEKSALEDDKKSLESEQKKLEDKQKELSALLEKNQDVLANLQSTKNETANKLAENLDELAGLDSEIADYYQKLKEQQKQQQQQQTSSSNNNNSSSGDNTYTPTDTTPIVSPPSNGGWIWPCPGFYYRSSTFAEDRGGKGHGALDIAGGGIMGAPVVAVADGTVISSYSSCTHNWGKYYSCGCGGGYGNYVMIDHGGGKTVIYGHFSSTAVTTGQHVSAGQVIGYVGSTGYSTGAHLHFECLYYGTRYDPETEY